MLPSNCMGNLLAGGILEDKMETKSGFSNLISSPGCINRGSIIRSW